MNQESQQHKTPDVLEKHHYTRSGLDSVYITAFHHTDEDGRFCICIPNIGELHMRIADALLKKEDALSGKEVYFLRAEMGYSYYELCNKLWIEEDVIERWENRNQKPLKKVQMAFINFATDRLIEYKEHGNMWRTEEGETEGEIHLRLTQEAIGHYLSEKVS